MDAMEFLTLPMQTSNRLRRAQEKVVFVLSGLENLGVMK